MQNLLWLCLLILPVRVTWAADAQSEVSSEAKAPKKIDSSVNLSTSSGSDQYSDSGVNLTVGLSPKWGLEVFTSATRLNGAVVEREYGGAPFVKLSENQQIKFEISVGGQAPTKSRTGSLEYDVNLAALWNGDLKTDLTLRASSTNYTVDGIKTSPRESQVYAGLSQDISDIWSVGASFTTSGYGDLAIKSYRRNSVSRGFDDTAGVFDSGPLDRQFTFFLGVNPSDAYGFEAEYSMAQPVGGGAKNISTSLSWTQNWTDKWSTGLKVSSAKVGSETKSSAGLNLIYTF